MHFTSPMAFTSATTSEQTPLLEGQPLSPTNTSKKASRNVTFNDNPTVRTIDSNESTQPKISFHSITASPTTNISSSFNSKLRRRNSYGSPQVPMHPASKIGPQRASKVTQKLKYLPDLEVGADGPDEESGRDVYSQFTRIKDPTARRDAARLGKADRDRLPRVTAFCTANKYQLDNVMRFLKGRGKTKFGANPKSFDECIYTPFRYGKDLGKATSDQDMEVHSAPLKMTERRHSDSAIEVEDNKKQRREGLTDLHTDGGDITISNGDHSPANNLLPEVIERQIENETQALISESNPDFDTRIHTPEVFLFGYGVVVIWGMSSLHEQKFLKEIAKFESGKFAADDVEMESFNFYYTKEYQARIYNDFITLREKGNYMTKLAISHGLAQSVKTSLFESLVDNTIDQNKDIPTQIALTGTIALPRKQINMQIGELFILRINIHLNGSILDTPELFWAEPQLEPIYQAVRSYLEMDQRVKLLNERLDVIADLLAVLKDQLSHRHGEKLEWVVIVLIAVEILVAVLNIIVDLSVGE
ncbi:712b7608-c654-4e53-adc6-c2df83fb40b8 [Sclerotinia trifoliorum]|uniref:712b7608-c654-4e53-adc6-c2df83fb40b8 n=1 Tax=Sclerotinia trifoliorum TaxID=28548 RepID=A0A8H2VVJ7_9HELO|nr:712b7608-c654-4e53-adc6-c2df83fb40b8 [Sclerotinia trifoliorum]